MAFLRKQFLPWTAAPYFASEAEFRLWLQKRHRLFHRLRAVFLAAAAGLLLTGHILDRYPILVLTVIPLGLVLALSLALARTEAALDGQNNTQP